MTPPLGPSPSPCVALFLVLAGLGAAPAQPGAAQVSANPARPPDATAADTLAGLWDSPAARERMLEIYGGEMGEDVPPGVRAESELVGAYFREGRLSPGGSSPLRPVRPPPTAPHSVSLSGSRPKEVP